MINLSVAFWILVILFGIIGSMRGWAKELLVTCSVLVGLFIIEIFSSFGPTARFFQQASGKAAFWVPSLILILVVFAGYQTPAILRFASGKFMRERLADTLLGFFIGLLNGYLIFGSLWFYMGEAQYPFTGITAPVPPLPAVLNYLPPTYLDGPILFIAVGLSFLFILLVFI